jgi:hypothetical protein
MSVQLHKSNDLSEASTAAVVVPRPGPVTVADLNVLPKQTQLLVAHFLEQNNNEMTLLDGDTDVCALQSTDWLVSMPSSPIGGSSFKFKPRSWRQLQSLQRTFLTTELLSELKTYRSHKTAAYPWVW